MLHYYYRTKENLFQRVFQEKVNMIANSFEVIFDDDLPFEILVRSFVEKHFDFVMGNVGLVNFVYNEIRVNKENSMILRNTLLTKMSHVFNRFENMTNKEVLKGTIKAVKPLELFMNIITLNLSTSIFYSISGEMGLIQNFKQNKNFIAQRKENNVQYILYSLRA
jgi:hypothetical protein